ncbi:MAG: tyrosine-type recombinase/integrase [Planctomycetota bacterium]|jgi:integrase
MQQSEIMQQRLFEYIERSDLQESSVMILRRAVKWFLRLYPGMDPAAVRYGHVDDFRSWVKSGRSGASANTYVSMIKAFFGWMFKRGHIETDPFEGFKRFIVPERHYELYSADEISRIMSVADDRWKAIIYLGLNSMRKAEILNLCSSDIDFEKNLIHIQPKKQTASTWLWHIKDHNEALVGFDDTVAKLLIGQIERLGPQPYVLLLEKHWRANLKLQSAGRLSCDRRNCPWGNFNRYYKKLLQRAGVPDKRFHDLRGTFATERYKNGFDLIDLQALMRHSSIQTTARYIRRTDQRKLIAKSVRHFEKNYVANAT